MFAKLTFPKIAAGDVEEIFRKGEEGMQSADGFIRQMEIGKTYTQGTDRAGRPVMYVLDVRLASEPVLILYYSVMYT